MTQTHDGTDRMDMAKLWFEFGVYERGNNSPVPAAERDYSEFASWMPLTVQGMMWSE